jgi:hypothetical protein
MTSTSGQETTDLCRSNAALFMLRVDLSTR